VYPFSYIRPDSLAHAGELLDQNPDAKPLSGGMTLVPTLKQRLAAPSHLIDLTKLPELQGIAIENGVLRIGAATIHATVATSPIVRQAIPALSELAGLIADPQVRNRGTMGGSVANNDPAADYPSAVLGLGGTVVTNKRRIAADDFFVGMFETALEQGEIVIALELPVPLSAAYLKLRHFASGYAVVGVFVAKTKSGVRVAVTGAGSSVFRWHEAETALDGKWDVSALDNLHLNDDGLNSDPAGSAAYRAHQVALMTRRAVQAQFAA
jgi:carbon-monoxide dehydrogenase medium subunit